MSTRSRSTDEASSLDPGLLASGIAGLGLGLALAYGAGQVTSVPLQILLGLLALLALAFAAYAFGLQLLIVGIFLLMGYLMKSLDAPRPPRFTDHWPVWALIFVGLLVPSWAISAALYGYNAEQWLWTGGSVFVAVGLTLGITARRAVD